MGTSWHLRSLGIWGCTAALLAASPGGARAAEGWAEIGWNWRWASGSIIYNRDIAPVDLQDGGGTFRDSIGPFKIVSWDMLEAYHFDGVGGTMTTRNFDRTGCAPEDWYACQMISVSIVLGPLANGDPAQWRLDLTAQGRLDAHGLPVLGSDWEGGGPIFDGHLSNNLDDRTFGALDSNFGNWHYTVAKPVPEPASLALMALGLAGVGAMVRRRRQASPA